MFNRPILTFCIFVIIVQCVFVEASKKRSKAEQIKTIVNDVQTMASATKKAFVLSREAAVEGRRAWKDGPGKWLAARKDKKNGTTVNSTTKMKSKQKPTSRKNTTNK